MARKMFEKSLAALSVRAGMKDIGGELQKEKQYCLEPSSITLIRAGIEDTGGEFEKEKQ